MDALGFPRAALDLKKYNPDQPRVPAGSGRESGEWTTNGSSASTSGDEDHKVQLAGDVIHVGLLVDTYISRGPGGIPRTVCYYETAFGGFEWSFLGTGDCPAIRRAP
jgi:hypothetical protein